jgi:hypothetical protein
MHEVVPAIASILAAIVGLAIIAVLVGKNSQTSSVVQATSSGFASIINAAVSPVAMSSGAIGNGTFG